MKRFVYLGIAVFLALAGWTGAWFYFANEAKKAVTTLADADGVTTPKIVCGQLGVTGFPFRFDLDCSDASLTLEDVTATLAELRVSVLVYRPTHAILSARAPLSIQDAFTGSRQRLDFSNLEASVRLNGWKLARASVVGADFKLYDTVLDDLLIASAASSEAHLLDMPEQHDSATGTTALAVFAKTESFDAPGLTIDDARSSLEAEVSRVPDDIRAFGEPDILARWRMAGGDFKLFALKGDDASSRFEATGDLKLNENAEIEGQIMLSSTGLVERLGGVIAPEWQTLIIGTQAPDGSYSQTLNIRNGTVFSGLIPVFMLPPLL